jgi:hypothetical protein
MWAADAARSDNMKRGEFKRFVVYGFDGKPKQHYVVEVATHDASSAAGKKEVKAGHTIIIVDRSGSMYCDIAALKDMLKKLLTLEEYMNSSMIVSLISYSTSGDCKVHFDRVKVSDVMKAGSKQQAEINRIASSGLTCISQALNVAKGLVRPDEPTAIILHSDGYANDPSVWSEQRQVLSVCEGFRGQNVLHRRWKICKRSLELLDVLAKGGIHRQVQARKRDDTNHPSECVTSSLA